MSATDGGPDWTDDAQYIVSGDSTTASNPAPDSIDGSVPGYVPSGVWTNERYDPPSDGEMGYEFDVQSGQQVEVRLYFYDGFDGTSSIGDRVFDVSVEGQTIESFDVIEEYGDQTAGMKSFTVTSDGTIDVDFGHETENPQINAIEIVSVEPQPDELGASPTSVDFGTVVTGNSASETVTLSNLGNASNSSHPDIEITDVSITGTNVGAFSEDFSGSTTLAPGESTDVGVTFSPSDAQPKAATLEISHSGSNSPLTVDLSGEGASDVPVGFGVSGLDVSLGNPTSLDFGPDGRLYVSQQNGEIKAYNITRNDANDYDVTDTEVISAVQNIPNHDDDGSYNPNVNNRQVTGLTVEGTPSTPVIYVTSSDPRIGAGGGHTDVGLDTNSGVVSRLTQQGDGSWDHDMLVRGLPRSEENHASNGIQYDAEDNVLYVAQGGHTNKGAPSDNFALTPEYALSAAILEIDLDQINTLQEKDAANTGASYLYDLPTLDPSATPTDGPFGGMDGANMANWTSSSPVDVYAPGFRNPYDIALNSDGQLYSTDNSANPGWGGIVVNEGPQGECTNEQNEQDESSPPGVYHIDGEDYYGGHPNPTRGNDTSEFAAAVESGLHDPINCDYISPTNTSAESAALETYGPTPQGMDVYEASNFGGAMEGDLLLAMWNSGDVERVELNAAGTEATSSETLFQNIGNNPLDVHAQGDQGPFPGTVWAATYGNNDITVFEPNDYEGTDSPTCTADDPSASDYDPDGDADNDGYTNEDENAVGTDPCSQASQPEDWDQDGVPDSLDSDDDNDGLSDSEDPFAIDAQNGLDNTVPVDRQFEAGQHPQSLFGLGFTGLMTNGTEYADLYNGSKVRAGGATEKFSVDEVPFGDAYQSPNSQGYAFQYGVDAPDEPFVVRTTVVAPFSDDMTPENYQSAGMQIGAGDQDNYVKLVATAQDANSDPNGGVEFLLEEGGTVDNAESTILSEPGVFGSGQIIDLFLTVDPTTDPTPNDGSADVAVTAAYSINGSEKVEFGQTLPAPESWFTSNSVNGQSVGTAVGLISTANGASSTFSASWDRLTVKTAGANTAPTADAGADQTVTEGDTVTLDASASSDPDTDDTLNYTWTQTDGPSVTLSDASVVQPTFTAPDVLSNTTLTFEVEVDDGTANDTDTVSVTVQNNGTVGDVVYRINTGGDAYTDVAGNQWAADDYFNNPGKVTDAETQFGTTDIAGTDDDRLYLTERYWETPSGTEYSFPVENGTYTVRLHLAEIYFGSQSSPGDDQRVMSANIEGGPVELDSYDIHADVGADTATVTEYTVEVSDGSLDIDFSASANNPKIAAIEVIADDGTGGTPTDGEATIAIDDGEGIDATTWDAESFEITNTGDEPIETITLDLSTAVLPDVVFDPDGTAGDQGAKGFVLNNNGTSGAVTATVTDPHNGVNGSDGYDALVIDFGSFQPGESLTFEMDNDPTSIKGGSSVQSGEAGPISGLELSGSTMTAEFGDGTTAETSLFSDGSEGGSQGVADGTVAPAPTIDAAGVSLSPTTLSPDHTAATVASASQTITIDGPPGGTVTLLRIEGELNLDGVPTYDGTPGYDIEDYEANTAIQVEEYTASIGSDGTADIPVTLTNSSADGGLNYFIAAVEDAEGDTGRTSNVVVLELDPDSDTGDTTIAEAVASQNAPEDEIGLTEIQTAINWWATNAEVPGTGGQTISLQEIQSLINLWATDATVGDGETNQAPTIDAITDQGVSVGSSTTVPVSASDPDGDTLTLSVSGPDFVNITDNGDGTGTITIAGTTMTPGYHPVTVTADDGQATASEEFAVYVDEPDQDGTVIFATNAGGSEYTASDGTTYQADTNFAGGNTSDPSQISGLSATTEIANTDDDTLYRTERFGNFSYDVPVSQSGTYEVSLQFAEIFQGVATNDSPDSSGPTDGTNENDRLFDVALEGQTVISSYDIYSEVGPLTASDKTYTVEVTDGTLNIDFSTVNDNAKISAIKIEQLSTQQTNEPQVLHRVDAGNSSDTPAIDDGPDWTGVTGTGSQYLVGADDETNNNCGGADITPTDSVPSSTPDAVFDCEWYGNSTWAFDVASDKEVRVRLYIGNQFSGTNESGQREFNVSVEGTQVLTNYDPVADVGHANGTVKTFTVTSDGTIDVVFEKGAIENPLVNAIEIVEADSNGGSN